MGKKLNGSNNIVGLRISAVRKRHNLTQEQFALKISEYMGRKRNLTISSISAFESGRKHPSAEVLTAISELFNVSIGYLTGQDDDVPSAVKNDGLLPNESIRNIDKEIILPSNYALYHEKPVFIVFRDLKMTNRWGILDYNKKTLTLNGGEILSLNDCIVDLFPLEAYSIQAAAKRRAKPISAGMLQTMRGQFWVEVISADQEIRAIYNGWYIHNVSRTAIVKVSNGEILPLRGMGVVWNAYREPFDIVEQ